MLERLMQIPALGKFTLERLKVNAFNSFQVPLSKALENQSKTLEQKLKRMERTDIGKKLSIHGETNIKQVPETTYDFYAPFYENPSAYSFMYPLSEYAAVKTSGTTGKSKWFLIPYKAMHNVLRETALPSIFALFHDGEKITMEYGDTLYLNLGPAPYISGSVFNIGSREKRAPFLNLVPNINLSYKEKVDYFILNWQKIDAAWIMASTLVTQVIPALKKPIKLKGLMLMDGLVARAHKDEIIRFTNVSPKTTYASTETIAPTIPSVQHSMGFIFDPRRGYFEFVPLEKDKVQAEPVGLDEVKVGETYLLIFTDLVGEITRYNTANSFRCISKGDDIINTDYPVFEYHSRLDEVISIMNFTRIGEEELLAAFQAASLKVIDFTTRLNMDGGHEYLQIYVEIIGEKKAKQDLEKKIHQHLYINNSDYRALTDSFSYNPIKLEFLPKNTFAKYFEKKNGAFPKVCRIGMDDQEFERLTYLTKKHSL
jgi:hypothetical protein